MANNNLLEPVADGLPMRLSGTWATQKLDYLRRYMQVLLVAMSRRPWRAIHYVDLFAGPGKCRIRRGDRVMLGSPLLALTRQPPFTRLFLSDSSPACCDVLRARAAATSTPDRVSILCGDGDAVVEVVVNAIESIDRQYLPGRWSSLNLAFLDPEALELDWTTVQKLARVNRMDLIVYYPQMALNRACRVLVHSSEGNRVDRFFGDTQWREIYLEYRLHRRRWLHRCLIDHYKSKLTSLGYREVLRADEIAVGDEPLMRNEARKAPLYRLLFASKHPLGYKFWQDVVRRDVHGQMQMRLH